MTGSTSPLGFPYLVDGDPLSQLPIVMQELAQDLDDYLAALSAVGPVNWTALTLNVGWTGLVQYARRAGMVTVNLAITSVGGTWTAGYPIGTMPAGFRPAIQVYGVGQSAGAIRNVYVTTGGSIETNEASSGSIFGTFTYPV